MSDDLFESLRIAETALKQSAEIRQLHSTSVKIAMEQAEVARKFGLSNDAVIKNIGTAMESTLVPALRMAREQMNSDGMAAVILGLSAAIQAQKVQIPKGMETVVDALKVESAIIKNAAACVQTPAITALMEACQNQQLISGMESFLGIFASSKITKISNIAFLKSVSGVVSLEDGRLPYGWKSIINRMHKPTAEKLTQVTDVSADIENKNFVSDERNSASVHVGELNVITSTLDLFSEITVHDLIILQNTLAKGAAFALEEKAGRKIYEIIRNWNRCIDFDREYYFHCRANKAGEAPYTEDDMKRAPRSCVGPGRYNYSGICHYYFSDSAHGAKNEVLKHNREAIAQTAKLSPVKPIKLIDFSGENKKKIRFLDYIRFDVTDKAQLPREYLIPQFVASCCEKAGIDGIKYYGSKEYNNYVTWNDGYFEIVDMWTEE